MLEARFRCNGKIHAIRLTSKGKLAFLGHTQAELVASEAAEALGARCKCIEVLRAWRANANDIARDSSIDPWRLIMPLDMSALRRQLHRRGEERRRKRDPRPGGPPW